MDFRSIPINMHDPPKSTPNNTSALLLAKHNDHLALDILKITLVILTNQMILITSQATLLPNKSEGEYKSTPIVVMSMDL